MRSMSRRIFTPRGRAMVAVAASGLSLLVSPALIDPAPRLVWNASASAPIGLWSVAPNGQVAVGDHVLAWAPDPARRLAARRGYLPANVPMIKQVAALDGARVCAQDTSISVDGLVVATRRTADRQGRSLPWWIGCRRLSRGQMLLINRPIDSFDSRYFGPVEGKAIVGRARPLWLP